MLERAPDILEWRDSTADLARIRQIYLDAVCDGVGALLATLKSAAPKLFSRLRELLDLTPQEALERVLLAPEFTYRIFFLRQDDKGVGEFLRDALQVELAREGLTNARGWSALGDYAVEVAPPAPAPAAFQNRSAIVAPRLGGQVPLDFLSPYATKISLNDDEYGVVRDNASGVTSFYSPDEMIKIVAILGSVHDAIGQVEPAARYVIENFSKIVVVRRDDIDAQSFTSSSSGQYTCRTMIVNPHLSDVGGSILADALVHESIHGVLYMNERVSPWVLDKELYIAPGAQLISPWSGRDLLLRPFLQACFVWYGLLSFWSSALAANTFGKAATDYCRVRALRGFELGRLVDRVKPWHDSLSDEVLTTIDEMQARVTARHL